MLLIGGKGVFTYVCHTYQKFKFTHLATLLSKRTYIASKLYMLFNS